MGFPGRAPSRQSVSRSPSITSRIASGFGVTSSGRVTRRRTHHKKIKSHGSSSGMRFAREQMRKNEALMQQMIVMMAAKH
jgi:hypothetical protein